MKEKTPKHTVVTFTVRSEDGAKKVRKIVSDLLDKSTLSNHSDVEVLLLHHNSGSKKWKDNPS